MSSNLLSDDPLDPTIEINESSSDDETIASLRLKAREKSHKTVNFSRVDLSKPYYQVENGKIVPIKKSLLDVFDEPNIKSVFEAKPSNEIKHSYDTTKSDENNQNRKSHKTRKTKKKPDALDRLMAQIDAQLMAQGLPVPKSCPRIKNEEISKPNYPHNKCNNIDIKTNRSSECTLNRNIKTEILSLPTSFQNNDTTTVLEPENIKEDLNAEKIYSHFNKQNEGCGKPIVDVGETNEICHNVSDETFGNRNNLNDDFYWPEDSPDNESSRDTILNSVVLSGDVSKKTKSSKFEIMESNDGSFVQYKVYDQFEDFSSDLKTDEHLVTSSLQIQRCKQILNNRIEKEHRLKINNQKSLKVFKTYEAFLASYERFLKLSNSDGKKIVFYEYDGIKLNALDKIITDHKCRFPENIVKKEITDNIDINFDAQVDSVAAKVVDNFEIKKSHRNKLMKDTFDFGFKYERTNERSGRINFSYDILDPHGCELCGKTFKNKRALKEHNKIVHNVIKNERGSIFWNCEKCRQSFNDLKHFTDHQNRKHNEIHLHSVESNNKTELARNLFNHGHSKLNIQTNLKPVNFSGFQCDECYKNFATYKLMRSHFKYQHPKTKSTYPFKCKLCKTGFKRMTDLLGHTYFVHKVKILTKNTFVSADSNGANLLNSEQDSKQNLVQTFDSKLVIANSTSVLTKDCTITVSNKESSDLFESNDEIVSKGRMERDPLRYQMNKITVTIENGENLDLYKCERCPKVFAMQKSLADHKRRVHLKSNMNNPDYPFVCKPCKKGYKRSNDLMRHARLYHKVIIRNNRCILNYKKKIMKSPKLPSKKNEIEKTVVGNIEEFSDKSKNPVGNKHLSVIKNAWACDFCSKSYDTQKKWRDHRRRVHISRPVKFNTIPNHEIISTQISTKENALQDLFDEGLLEKNGHEKLICQYCEEYFDTFKIYKLHVNDKHLEAIVNVDSAYPYCCQKCRKVFTKSCEAIKHAKNVHRFILKMPHSDVKRWEYFCDSCPKQFRFKQSLRRHIESTHSMTIDPRQYLKCKDGCSRSFQSQVYLERHIRLYSHFRCLTCNMHFSNQTMLDKHQVCHTKDRQYICPVCTNTYMQKHHLIQHELIHGEKKHKCPYCPIACYTGSQLNSHLRIHSSNRPFKCSFCPDTFKRAQALRQHERLHTGEKSTYCCNNCDRSFRSSNGLVRHERSHRIGRIASRISQLNPTSDLQQQATIALTQNLQADDLNTHGNENFNKCLENSFQSNDVGTQADDLLQSHVNILELK